MRRGLGATPYTGEWGQVCGLKADTPGSQSQAGTALTPGGMKERQEKQASPRFSLEPGNSQETYKSPCVCTDSKHASGSLSLQQRHNPHSAGRSHFPEEKTGSEMVVVQPFLPVQEKSSTS